MEQQPLSRVITPICPPAAWHASPTLQAPLGAGVPVGGAQFVIGGARQYWPVRPEPPIQHPPCQVPVRPASLEQDIPSVQVGKSQVQEVELQVAPKPHLIHVQQFPAGVGVGVGVGVGLVQLIGGARQSA